MLSAVSSRTVPIDFVLAMVAFARDRGWDVEGMLRQAGVSPMLLAEGRSRVTEEQITRFTQALWRHTDDEMFGLSPHPLPRGSFRLLCYGLIGATDLAAMLDRLQGLARAMPALPPIRADLDDDLVRVSVEPRVGPELDVVLDDELLGPLIVCVALAVVHRLLAWAIGGRLSLTAVELPYAEQRKESHDLVFGAPLVFEAQRAAITFDADLLRSPVIRNESELDEFIARSPAGLLTRPTAEPTAVEQVRRMVHQSLRTDGTTRTPSGDEIAVRLAISPQTLRRRLAAEGTSLRVIRDAVLRDAAVTGLVESDMPLAELSARLGFSEPSAFTRAFRRWTGNPPSTYRSTIAAGDD